MTRALAITGCALSLLACSAFKGEVEHPKPGEKNSVEACAKNDSEENSCMHCASKPGCGYCTAPAPGSPPCQPGISGDNTPTTCGTALTISTTECSGPPPPLEEE
jgi:hypothetical protein